MVFISIRVRKDTNVVPEKTCENYTTKVSTVGQILLQCCRKDNFVFTRNVNNHGINPETVCQIVKFISHFSGNTYKILKMFLQYGLMELGSS